MWSLTRVEPYVVSSAKMSWGIYSLEEVTNFICIVPGCHWKFISFNWWILFFSRKVNEKWKDWLYFSCFIVVNHFTTVFCGQTGVQGYPMLLFLETDFQVTKKGEDQKLWRTQLMIEMSNNVIWWEGMTWHTNNLSGFCRIPHSSAQ